MLLTLDSVKATERSGNVRNASRLSSENKYNPKVSFQVRLNATANWSHVEDGSHRYGVELSISAVGDSSSDLVKATDAAGQEVGAFSASLMDVVMDEITTSGCLDDAFKLNNVS